MKIARLVSLLLALCAAGVAFVTDSIGTVFTFILNLTAAIGPVYFLRWFWWRINPWSEMIATAVSLPVILARPALMNLFGIPHSLTADLLFMILGAALFWVPATYLTPPVPERKLKDFFDRVQPPGWWKWKVESKVEWKTAVRLWIISTIALLLTTAGPLKWLLGDTTQGIAMCLGAAFFWFWTLRELNQSESLASGGTPLR